MVEQACDKHFYSKREEKGSDRSQVNTKPNKENSIKHYRSRIALLTDYVPKSNSQQKSTPEARTRRQQEGAERRGAGSIA